MIITIAKEHYLKSLAHERWNDCNCLYATALEGAGLGRVDSCGLGYASTDLHKWITWRNCEALCLLDDLHKTGRKPVNELLDLLPFDLEVEVES